MTCKTCKHWGKEPQYWRNEDISVDIRMCFHPMVCVFRGYGEQPIMNPSGVYTFDEGGGTGDFTTAADFGCIHHQPILKDV